jgi:serine/threonine protein kinase
LITPPAKEDINIPFSYCAPEVIFAANASPYSEIRALGCVLFELRAGWLLFFRSVGGRRMITTRRMGRESPGGG